LTCIAFTHATENIVHMNPFLSTHSQPLLHPFRWPRAAQKLVPALLAGMLMAYVATPSFAGTPVHGHHGGHHEQQQQALSVAGKHHGKSRTVTKNFSNASTIAIPGDTEHGFGPADPYPSTIDVSGFKQGKIADLNLALRGFSHTFPSDVGVLLVAPDGSNAIVMDAVGDVAEVSDLTLTLDDEAANPLPDSEGLTSGSFRPLDAGRPGIDGSDLVAFPAPAPTPSGDTALSTFDGGNPNGQWQFFVIDSSGGDVGALADGWSLEITAQVKTKKHRH
jgi:hypothetical protein